MRQCPVSIRLRGRRGRLPYSSASAPAVVLCRKGKDPGLGFEIIDIRRFEAQEFSDLLESESRTWSTALRWDFAASVRIINSCLRDKRLSGYALVDAGKIQGYCFFFYDGEKGIVGDLYLHPGLAGRGRECELLEHALETLLATPGLRRIEAQLPHYERQALESCFLSAASRAICGAS